MGQGERAGTTATGSPPRRPVGRTASRWARTAHRWASVGFVVLLLVVLVRPDDAVFIVPLVACAVVVLLTGLQMHVRHLNHRRRRRARQRSRGPLSVGEAASATSQSDLS